MSNWITVLLIGGVAVLLRVYALDHLPPGLFGDEAVEGLDALDVLAGNFAIWFHAHLGREPLYVYLVALSYRFFGVTPIATRLPAVLAGLLTVPATFVLAREWARNVFGSKGYARADRIAVLATALIGISFWHIQMTRDAHRDTLLPLVEAIGYWLLWRGLRTNDWRVFVAAGGVLGLAIYTYSPGRFVSVFIALFIATEWIIHRLLKNQHPPSFVVRLSSSRLFSAAFAALVVMLPLGLYFVQNPVQFSRRFESVSILDADSPPAALVASVSGNLAQFIVPGAGYQSKHYNLPGRPVFDLLIAPWFLVGFAIAVARSRQAPYRFLLLWFAVMLIPAFLTADMIPKGVRALGIVPGVFLFPAIAMDDAVEWLAGRRSGVSATLASAAVALFLVGSTLWTAYDYFVAWANMPELPLAFDEDMVELSRFVQQQPLDRPIYISSEVYRHPTEMLLGRHVPTTRYTDRAARIREFDARTTWVYTSGQGDAVYIFVREHAPPGAWLDRVARASPAGEGSYLSAVQPGSVLPPKQQTSLAFSPLLTLIGYTLFDAEPRGVALYWQVTQLPDDRRDLETQIAFADARGNLVTQEKRKFGYLPLDWALGDIVVEWYALELPANATQFTVEIASGRSRWQSAPVVLE